MKIYFFCFTLISCFPIAMSAHEVGSYEKYLRETYITTFDEYTEYLNKGYSRKTDGFYCLFIKLDFIIQANEMLSSNEDGYPGELDYYDIDDHIVFHSNIFQQPYTDSEFTEWMKDLKNRLRRANNPKGNIPSESLYLATLVRLFSNYTIYNGDNEKTFDLSGYKKCTTTYGDEHQ